MFSGSSWLPVVAAVLPYLNITPSSAFALPVGALAGSSRRTGDVRNGRHQCNDCTGECADGRDARGRCNFAAALVAMSRLAVVIVLT